MPPGGLQIAISLHLADREQWKRCEVGGAANWNTIDNCRPLTTGVAHNNSQSGERNGRVKGVITRKGEREREGEEEKTKGMPE